MQEQDFTFFNIVPYSSGNEELAAMDAVEYTRLTGNRIVLYSLTLHPEYPAYENLKKAAESFRKFKNLLAGTDVEVGILLQAILGHWPRQDKEIDPWQRTVNVNGELVRFCPLDPGYQEYIRKVGETLAKEKPAFFMIDDDVRAYSPHAECFCPLHAKEFSRRMGKDYTPQELVEAVKKSQKGEKEFETFLKLQREIPEGVASLVREGLDSVDPSIPGASCMAGVEARFSGQISMKIASRHQKSPIMRIANAFYMESSHKDFAYVLFRTMSYFEQHCKKIPFMLDEADTFPHHLYSRSSRNFHTKLTSSAFLGLKGAKVWFVNMHRNDTPISRRYTEELSRNRGLYQTLAREAGDSQRSGVIIPLHKNYLCNTPIQGDEYMYERFSWAETHLGMFGIPYRVSFDLGENGVYLISGAQTIRRFNDEELKTLLSGKLLLDGAAATEVTRRGFAGYLGVTAEQKPIKFHLEKARNPLLTMRLDRLPEVPFLTVTDPAAEILTDLCYKPRSCDNELEKVAPGTVLFRNKLGGHICVTAFCTVWRGNNQLEENRKDFLLALLDQLNGEALPFVVMDYQNVAALTREKANGETLMAVYNINFDRLDPISIRCAKPSSVEFLAPSGEWKKLEFSYENGIALLSYGLECLEGVILKIKK